MSELSRFKTLEGKFGRDKERKEKNKEKECEWGKVETYGAKEREERENIGEGRGGKRARED